MRGVLNPYNSGRSEEFNFEPEYFMDDDTEEYYDNNWEDIEEQILNKFNNSKF